MLKWVESKFKIEENHYIGGAIYARSLPFLKYFVEERLYKLDKEYFWDIAQTHDEKLLKYYFSRERFEIEDVKKEFDREYSRAYHILSRYSITLNIICDNIENLDLFLYRNYFSNANIPTNCYNRTHFYRIRQMLIKRLLF